MGYEGKYGRIETPDMPGHMPGHIPDDEPVMLFRARDTTTNVLLKRYYDLCVKAGSPQKHLDLIQQTFGRFADWQAANPDKVRVPTSSSSYPEKKNGNG
jgi:hypothetical protein